MTPQEVIFHRSGWIRIGGWFRVVALDERTVTIELEKDTTAWADEFDATLLAPPTNSQPRHGGPQG